MVCGRAQVNDPMMNTVILRWLLPTSALFVFGPLVALPISWLHDPTGGDAATPLLSGAPVLGIVSIVLIAIVAIAGGAITARFTAPGTGRTFAGLCVAWAAMRTASSWTLFEIHGGGAIIPLAIEGLIVAAAGAAVVLGLTLGGGFHTKETLKADLKVAIGSPNAAIGIVIGVAAGIVGTVFVAIDGGRGQSLAGGYFGAVLAAVAVQLAAQTITPEQARLRASASVLALMVISPLILLVMPGGGSVAEAARAGSLVGPGLVQPLDWLVGILLGVPTGMVWVGSVSEKANQQAANQARRSVR